MPVAHKGVFYLNDTLTLTGEQKNKGQGFINLLSNHTTILTIILISVFIFGSIFVPAMLQKDNLLNILRMSSIVGLVAVGTTVVLLTGEIDLSVGSIMSFSLVFGGLAISSGSIPALLLTFLAGAFLGLINGLIVAKFKISSLMVTLGTLSIFGGLANILTRGQAIFLYDSPLYLMVGRGYFAGIPIPAIIFTTTAVVIYFILMNTKFGKEVYFTGANEKAARISGVNVDKIKISAYIICGLCAALAGPILSTQTNRITPIQGAGYELTAIAIAVLGGTSLDGGKGSIIGTVLGALTFVLLLNVLTLSGVGTYMEQVLKGIMLIVIVMVYHNVGRR